LTFKITIYSSSSIKNTIFSNKEKNTKREEFFPDLLGKKEKEKNG